MIRRGCKDCATRFSVQLFRLCLFCLTLPGMLHLIRYYSNILLTLTQGAGSVYARA